MEIQETYYRLILNEFKDVERLCTEAQLMDDKLYFFSASYGIINRVMNIECDPLLVFTHQTLQSVHLAIQQRLSNSRALPGIANGFPVEMWNAAFLYFHELVLAFEQKNDPRVREILQKFSNLSYATNGNGFYLYSRGKLVL
jgi:hypothetical protein